MNYAIQSNIAGLFVGNIQMTANSPSEAISKLLDTYKVDAVITKVDRYSRCNMIVVNLNSRSSVTNRYNITEIRPKNSAPRCIKMLYKGIGAYNIELTNISLKELKEWIDVGTELSNFNFSSDSYKETPNMFLRVTFCYSEKQAQKFSSIYDVSTDLATAIEEVLGVLAKQNKIKVSFLSGDYSKYKFDLIFDEEE